VRLCYVFLAHQDLKPRAGPRKVFTHSSRRVSPDHCLNAGIFERALGQVRLGAATIRLDDNKLTVLHSSIIARVSGSARFAKGAPFEAQGKQGKQVAALEGVANLGVRTSNQLQ